MIVMKGVAMLTASAIVAVDDRSHHEAVKAMQEGSSSGIICEHHELCSRPLDPPISSPVLPFKR